MGRHEIVCGLRVSCNRAGAYAILDHSRKRGMLERDTESALRQRRICVPKVPAVVRARKVD